jgi:uncharacterized membrane protein HdeD (DUF308 family)
MQQKKLKKSSIFLILGLVFLVIGFSAENTIFTWLAIAFLVISLIFGGRWLRPRKR